MSLARSVRCRTDNDPAAASPVILPRCELIAPDFLLHDKRASKPADATPDHTDLSIIDLSHTIENGMITYKGLPAPIICDHISHLQSRGSYAPGTEFQIGRIDMVANTGTYIDTPYHRYPGGTDLSTTPLPNTAHIPGVVVRVTGIASRAIDWPIANRLMAQAE